MSRSVHLGPARFASGRQRSRGFTIMDVLIATVIVGILVTIAVPAYTSSVVKSKRRAAQVCLASFATHMERYYTTNLRYNVPPSVVDPDDPPGCNDGEAPDLPPLECASAQNAGRDYDFTVTSTCSTYTLAAAPKNAQESRDEHCAILSLNQAGVRGVTGADGVAKCW